MPLEALCLQKPPHLLPEDPEGTVTQSEHGASDLDWKGRCKCFRKDGRGGQGAEGKWLGCQGTG